MKVVWILIIALMLSNCQSAMDILAGATHARGTIHVEGYFTDTQGEVEACKVPDNYTPEQAAAYCHPDN